MSDERKNTIKETAVGKLLGMNFFIPGYQRGYRWTEQQVNDLLNDINEFEPKNGSWYCLQPLVVMKKDGKDEKWEVIDGQQRLTTIYLILEYLEKDTKKAESAEQKKTYSIEYETRKGSKEFLENILKEPKTEKAEDEAKATKASAGSLRAETRKRSWLRKPSLYAPIPFSAKNSSSEAGL